MIIYDEPIDIYHGRDARTLGSSRISQFREHGAPWWYLRYIAGEIPNPEPSEGMRQGSMLDAAMTDQKAWNTYIAKPEGYDGRTKEGKAWAAENASKTIVPSPWFDIVSDCIEAIGRHQTAADMLNDARMRKQVTLRAELGNGLTLQSRPDFLMLDPETKSGWYIDLKKTNELDAFGRKAIDYGYHRQLALAQWLAAAAGYRIDAYLLAVEWQRGARARLYSVPESVLEAGWREAKETIDEIAARFQDNDWSDDHDGDIDTLDIPGWMLAKMEGN